MEQTVCLEERLYLRVLELVVARLEGNGDGWLYGKDMRGVVGNNTEKVRREFSDILQEVRLDPIFESRNRGREKRVGASPEQISVQAGLFSTSHNWADEADWKNITGKLKMLGFTPKGDGHDDPNGGK